VLVVGSGIAGLTFALQACKKSAVRLVTKRALEESNTAYSQGGIAAVISPEDSVESHVRDTLEAGAGLCREDVARAVCSAAPKAIRDLEAWGVRFSSSEAGDSTFELGLEGGHSRRRILHSGDMTGREVERALTRRVREDPNIEVLESHIAVDLILESKVRPGSGNGRCLGAYVLDIAGRKVEKFLADATVLATGGAGKVYLYTTNPDIATGDGIAMAWRAGLAVRNLEFVQFHPTCLYHPKAKSFLISEAVRGEGGRLLDAGGRAFMAEHHPRKDLAPRDVVARAIDFELKKTGVECVYLDISHRGAAFVEKRFPNLTVTCRKFGYDLAREPVPVVPAAHYFCGGVAAGLDGGTDLPGLYVIGEAASTGLHGANRLASNSLLEGLVAAGNCAARVGEILASGIRGAGISIPDWNPGNAKDPDEQVVIAQVWNEIRHLMWNYVGIVRTDKRLERALRRIELLRQEIQDYYWDFIVTSDLIELRNLAVVAECVIRSALARKESRGLHTTLDYPELSPGVPADTVLKPPARA